MTPAAPGQRNSPRTQTGGNVYCSDFLLNDDERNLDYQRFAARHGTFGVFGYRKAPCSTTMPNPTSTASCRLPARLL